MSTTKQSVISEDLLKILCCPQSHQPLAIAPEETIHQLNSRIKQGAVKSVNGTSVTTPVDAGLLRADHKVLYRISDGIPILLIDEGILISNA